MNHAHGRIPEEVGRLGTQAQVSALNLGVCLPDNDIVEIGLPLLKAETAAALGGVQHARTGDSDLVHHE